MTHEAEKWHLKWTTDTDMWNLRPSSFDKYVIKTLEYTLVNIKEDNVYTWLTKDNLDPWLTMRTTSTLDWQRGQPWHWNEKRTTSSLDWWGCMRKFDRENPWQKWGQGQTWFKISRTLIHYQEDNHDTWRPRHMIETTLKQGKDIHDTWGNWQPGQVLRK